VESSAVGFRPHACVITNISNAHMDLYKTLDNILWDKTSLERHLHKDGVVFFDIDDERLRNAPVTHRVITYALDREDADYRAINIKTDENAKFFDILCEDGMFPAKINIVGNHNVRNALAAFAVGRWLKIPPESIVKSLEKYKPSGIRQNLMNVGGFYILLDAFNSNPTAVIEGVKAMNDVELPEGGKRVAIVGDIYKLGERTNEFLQDLGKDLANHKQYFDILYCFGIDAVNIYESAKENGVESVYHSSDLDELTSWIEENVKRNDITLYKGGHNDILAAFPKAVDAVYGTMRQKFAQDAIKAKTNIEVDNNRFSLMWEHLEFNGLMVDSETDPLTAFEVPAEIEGCSLKRIGENAFARRKELQSVVIPDSVMNIGHSAFYVCSSLEQITLPENLKYIERSAFNHCLSLRSVVLPPKTLHLEIRAFYECKNLVQIYIPESVGYIGTEAFGKCPVLTIYGHSGSYAEEYALKNEIPFVVTTEAVLPPLKPLPPQIHAESAILVDVESNNVIYSKNEHRKEIPSSIVNILVCMVALENGLPFIPSTVLSMSKTLRFS